MHPGDPTPPLPPAVVARVADLPRRIRILGDDLADGLAGLAWRGRARDAFARRLHAELAGLAATADLLARRLDDAIAPEDPHRRPWGGR